jgi:hypothetical protein
MHTRDENDILTELSEVPHSWPAAISATTTVPLRKLRRPTRFEAVDLVVDTTYNADPVNFYVITLQRGATVIATWSTQTGQQGTLTAGVIASMVLSATDLNRVGVVDETLQLVFTKAAAAANLPIGRICAHSKYV